VSVLLLSGCTSDCSYTVDHERLVGAAMEAIAEEAHVKFGDITRNDCEEKGGKMTILTATYIDYSKLKVIIDSSEENCKVPALKVQIKTGDVLPEQHGDFENRLHEMVLLKLRARKHGEESKPTALPPIAPTVPQAAAETKPAPTQPAVTPVPRTEEKK
jgi:hypothetical protein